MLIQKANVVKGIKLKYGIISIDPNQTYLLVSVPSLKSRIRLMQGLASQFRQLYKLQYQKGQILLNLSSP